MKQSNYYIGLFMVMLILYLLPACSPGPVIVKGKKHQLYKGNWGKVPANGSEQGEKGQYCKNLLT